MQCKCSELTVKCMWDRRVLFSLWLDVILHLLISKNHERFCFSYQIWPSSKWIELRSRWDGYIMFPCVISKTWNLSIYLSIISSSDRSYFLLSLIHFSLNLPTLSLWNLILNNKANALTSWLIKKRQRNNNNYHYQLSIIIMQSCVNI